MLFVNIVNKNQIELGLKEILSVYDIDEDFLYSSNDMLEDLYNSLYCFIFVEECVNVIIFSNVEDEQY